MKTGFKITFGSAASFCVFLIVAQSASAFIVDEFSMSQTVQIANGVVGNHATGEAPAGLVPDPSVLGGYRDIDINLTRLHAGYSVGNIEAKTTGPSLGYTEAAGVSGGQMWVTWDGGQDDPANTAVNKTGLGSVDFTVGGVQNLLAVGVYTQVGGNDLYLTVWDTVGAGRSQTLHQTVNGDYGDQIIKFNYSLFTDVDMTKIGAVQLHWATNPLGYGATANFNFFKTGSDTAVPEPGTVLLLGGSLIGLCGGAFRRLRRTV